MAPPTPPAPSFPIRSSVPFVACPLRAGLGCLGRRWALVVLRDIAFLRETSFGAILRRNPGLTPRVLSMRLRELRAEGLIARIEDVGDRRRVRYRLTGRGADAVPIVTAFIQYGIRHHAREVFADHTPRDLDRTFPTDREFLLGRLARYARGAGPGPPHGRRAGLGSRRSRERVAPQRVAVRVREVEKSAPVGAGSGEGPASDEAGPGRGPGPLEPVERRRRGRRGRSF